MNLLIESIGYLGSILVLVSFLMTSVEKLRIVNTIGGLIFSTYALIIHSYPTAIMNLCLIAINLRFLWKLKHTKPNYRLVPVSPAEGYVKDFLKCYADDIAACFPGRSWNSEKANRAWLICFETSTAGILLGNVDNGVLNIALDYTTPAFRNYTVGPYLLSRLSGEGIQEVRYIHAEPGHVHYLEKMGYTHNGECWSKKLS